MALEVSPARRLSSALIVVLALLHGSGDAHGPIHARIDQVSLDIERAPGYADLYLVRADLFRLDEDWVRASADLDMAEDLGAAAGAVALYRADLALDQEDFKGALETLIPLRRRATAQVMFAHVRAYQGLGDLRSAIFWLDRCLSSAELVPADWYLLRSRLILTDAPEAVEVAVRGLDEGMAARGFDRSIALHALDLEIQGGLYERALKRLSGLEQMMDRDEELLARRGDILIRTGRPFEAEAAYSEALNALESLPPSRRSSPATTELEGHVRSALAGGTGN